MIVEVSSSVAEALLHGALALDKQGPDLGPLVGREVNRDHYRWEDQRGWVFNPRHLVPCAIPPKCETCAGTGIVTRPFGPFASMATDGNTVSFPCDLVLGVIPLTEQ